jgi:phosphoheptose isomerase
MLFRDYSFQAKGLTSQRRVAPGIGASGESVSVLTRILKTRRRGLTIVWLSGAGQATLAEVNAW